MNVVAMCWQCVGCVLGMSEYMLGVFGHVLAHLYDVLVVDL